MESNNTKALREALEDSNGLLEELAAIGEWGEAAREQISANNAALGSPIRNCDMFSNGDDAYQAWRDLFRKMPQEDVPMFSDWLFSTK